MDMELGSKKSRILAWTFKSRFPFSSLSTFSYCYDVISKKFYSVYISPSSNELKEMTQLHRNGRNKEIEARSQFGALHRRRFFAGFRCVVLFCYFMAVNSCPRFSTKEQQCRKPYIPYIHSENHSCYQLYGVENFGFCFNQDYQWSQFGWIFTEAVILVCLFLSGNCQKFLGELQNSTII